MVQHDGSIQTDSNVGGPCLVKETTKPQTTTSSPCGGKIVSSSHHPSTSSTNSFKNVVFDFDSTVIKSESLEVMLEVVLADDPLKEKKMKEIAAWTEKGMNGECSFKEGLEARLKIASPTLADLEKFCQKYCPSDFSAGMEDLVAELHKSGHEVFILSGGFRDLILPFARHLHVPDENVFAVEINWDSEGRFDSLNETNGFAVSKLDGAAKIQHRFADGRTVAIGDGFTDYKLYESGICADFIAYTEHAARDKVIAVAPRCAPDAVTLWKYLLTKQCDSGVTTRASTTTE
ncbi:unnamed protein product [Amoebophrya sp. A120]|nr:unnamed protein product [Amoebophrya sp. A120]|eukprot:GSA120T00016289001.1